MPGQNLGGRPTKFTPERRASILQDIADRIPYELAAQANGICEDTLYAWLKQGFDDIAAGIDSEFAQFSEDLKRVESKKIKYHLTKMKKNVKNWQADAWILERRWHKLFGPNAQLIELNERLSKLEKGGVRNEKLSGQESNESHKTSETS